MRRIVLVSLALVAALLALHVQLNLGGWSRFLGRLGSSQVARGELVVGFLPVT